MSLIDLQDSVVFSEFIVNQNISSNSTQSLLPTSLTGESLSVSGANINILKPSFYSIYLHGYTSKNITGGSTIVDMLFIVNNVTISTIRIPVGVFSGTSPKNRSNTSLCCFGLNRELKAGDVVKFDIVNSANQLELINFNFVFSNFPLQ